MSSDKFEFAGGREMVSGERARELLKDAPATPTSVRLSNKSLSREAAQEVAAYLKSFAAHGCLTHLDISDIIAGRPEEEALAVMLSLCAAVNPLPLLEVNLSDNAIGFRGVESIRNLLDAKQLQRLFVCNNGMSAEAVQLLSEALLAGEKGCPPLTTLHLYNNMCGNGGATAIASVLRQTPGLVDFRYSATRTSAAGCVSLCVALGELERLERLDLSDNSFGAAGGAALAKCLHNHRALQHLNLRDSGIGEAGGQALMACVRDRELLLTFLDLSGNDLSEKFIDGDLATTASQLKKLKELHLDDNELGSDGARALARIISAGGLPSLTHLSLCSCELTAAGAVLLARAVVRLPNFSCLRVDGNAICERGMNQLQGLLGTRLVELEDNDEEGEDDLPEEAEDEDVLLADALQNLKVK